MGARMPGTLVIQNGREPVYGGVGYVGVFASSSDQWVGRVWVRQ